MTTADRSQHVLDVSGLKPDPNHPGHLYDDNLEASVECLDPNREHCKLWLQCCNADLMTVLQYREVTFIHGEAHRVRNGVLVTDTGECISNWDDCNEVANELASVVGNGRWYVDVKWTDCLEITVGTQATPALEIADV